jgi:hypothetical protein
MIVTGALEATSTKKKKTKSGRAGETSDKLI